MTLESWLARPRALLSSPLVRPTAHVDSRKGRQVWLALLLLCASCNRGASDGTTTAEERRTEPQPISAKDCKGGDAQTVDVNNDGKPDITHRVDGKKRICSVMDLNFDGRTDLLRFYGEDGKSVVMEQHDYDFDGRIDDQIFSKGGKVTHKELDTNFDGLIDTWMWCKGPLVEKAERARRKPGRVDTWETYSGGMLAEIQYDENADGRVEKWERFEGGSLVEVKVDTTGDGKADRTDPAGEASSDQRDKPVSCDGSQLPDMDEKFPGGSGETPASGDAGVIPGSVGAPDADAGIPDGSVTTPTSFDAGAAAAGTVKPVGAGALAVDAGPAKLPDGGTAKLTDAGTAKADAGRANGGTSK